ncbi:hypothetical protein, partial [Vreelandella glaciei]|uniref:hypothetical protein n=1 Tax=Vreelandella glaciei TaxID=186761 RepID=UPI0030EC59C7
FQVTKFHLSTRLFFGRITSRGVFSKALSLGDLTPYFLALLITIPVLTLLSVWGLRKQER